MNSNAAEDARNVVTGKDAKIYITGSDNVAILLAEAESLVGQLNVTNTDYQPLGSPISLAVATGYTVSVTLTEVVVRDDIMLEKIYEDLENGYMPQWDIRSDVTRRDGEMQSQSFRACVPDGSVDLINITAGEIMKRPWTFRANATPKLLKFFKGRAA